MASRIPTQGWTGAEDTVPSARTSVKTLWRLTTTTLSPASAEVFEAQGPDLVRGDARRKQDEIVGGVLGHDAVHGVPLAAVGNDLCMRHAMHDMVIGHDDPVTPVEKTRAVALARAADENDGGSDSPVEIRVAEREHAFLFLRVEFHDGCLAALLTRLANWYSRLPLRNSRRVVKWKLAKLHVTMPRTITKDSTTRRRRSFLSLR